MKERTKSKKARDKRDEHIISQMWKADQVARKISNFTGLPFEELRDAALEYIVRIYDTWDQSKGANFSTWVNRCLQFHMLNYLRDSSRLVKMPRSYSDLYLKIRKYLIKNPNITNQQIADDLKISVKKVDTVRTAFTMSFNPVTEQNCVIEPTGSSEVNFADLLVNHKDLLFRITDLENNDETFLIDYLVKKRSISTLLRKNSHLKNIDDIKSYSTKLINYILWADKSFESWDKTIQKPASKKSGQKSSKTRNATTL
jgi:DNA-directed RNA polymerase sigma subunit (sigma70/sigma32)